LIRELFVETTQNRDCTSKLTSFEIWGKGWGPGFSLIKYVALNVTRKKKILEKTLIINTFSSQDSDIIHMMSKAFDAGGVESSPR
jgi:hypothetical protein